MKRRMYSELRTYYETSAEDPNSFRLTICMKDLIDGAALRQAAGRTMARYPWFCVRLCMEGTTPCLESNPAPVPVRHSEKRSVLGGEAASGHLLAFGYWENNIFVDVWHGLTDGGGLAPLLQTLLYCYCSAYYGVQLSDAGIRLPEGQPAQAEWDDPAARPLGTERKGLGSKWSGAAFQLGEGGIARLTPECVSYDLRIPEDTFMRFNISNDGSPATIVSLLLARTVDALHPGAALPPVIGMCVNQRKALRAPLAHQSLVGEVRLPFTERVKKLPFSLQATCFRGMVTLQSDADMVLDEVRDYQELYARLEAMDDPAARRAYCREQLARRSQALTAVVSYVGKADLGEAGRYVQDCGALPSTALPSVHTPLVVELSTAKGHFLLSFLQYFRERDYYDMFARQLRQNDIDYDLLRVTEARFPQVAFAR